MYNLSVSLALASSPGRKDSLRPEGDVANSDRGRTTFGRPGKPCCPNRQQLRHYALTRCIWQAAVNQNSGAQLFPIAENFVRPVQPPPTRQWLPYQGSWREAPERLYPMPLHSCRKAALRTTSPSPAVTPLLVGEAFASRKLHRFVFSRSARSSLGVM